MIIKNHDILVRRAEEHLMLDHIAQKTYGDIYYLQNGDVEPIKWQGCAISCLATETTIEKLKNQEDLDFDAVFVQEHSDGRNEFTVRVEPDDLREMLHNKFGMCFKLIQMAECIFEGSDEEYAKTWPLKFANALANGKDITDDHIDTFWSTIVEPTFNYGIEMIHFPDRFEPGWDDPEYGVWGIDEYFEFFDEGIGEEFINFLLSINVTEPEQLALV